MREEEKFVRDALLAFLGSSSTLRSFDGEDPPDFYLEWHGGSRVAVEVTRLTQGVPNADGSPGNRESHDNFGLQLIEKLNDEFGSKISDTMSLVVCMHLPATAGRSFKKALCRMLEDVIRESIPGSEAERIIEGAKVSVTVVAERHAHKKIRGIIANRNSSADILLNARCALEDRIRAKDKICGRLATRSAIWLAMLNEYWLADSETYRQAWRQLDIPHCFERIFVIHSSGGVTEL
jgi:hypothetical protein